MNMFLHRAHPGGGFDGGTGGRYRARFADGQADLRAAQALRHLCFVERGGALARPSGLDTDDFDAACQHVLIEDGEGGPLAGCFRLMPLAPERIWQSYSAQYYDLSRLVEFGRPTTELGRFCIHPQARNADVLRVAWGALTRHVDQRGVGLLFGCSSFAGVAPAPYLDAFALLAAGHLAPPEWRPEIRAQQRFDYAAALAGRAPEVKAAHRQMPPLLRTYLAMGGWVSDHAVVDPAMNTLHVFTALDIGAVPKARARALRAIAGGA